MTDSKIYGTKQADGEARSPFGSPSEEQRIVKGVPLSVGAKLQPKDRSPPYMGEAVTALALPLYHTPPHFYKAKRKRREECGWRR